VKVEPLGMEAATNAGGQRGERPGHVARQRSGQALGSSGLGRPLPASALVSDRNDPNPTESVLKKKEHPTEAGKAGCSLQHACKLALGILVIEVHTLLNQL
jgi:hypothetical protein